MATFRWYSYFRQLIGVHQRKLIEMTQMKKCLAFLFLLFFGLVGKTQGSVKNHFLYALPSFSIAYNTGLNKGKVSPTFGENNRFNLPITQSHQLNLAYAFPIYPHFGITLGCGIGLLPIKYDFILTSNLSGSETIEVSNSNYNLFSRIHVMADYHHWISKRIAFKGEIGGGFYKYTALESTSGSSQYTLPQSYVKMQFPGNFTPNLSVALGFDFLLKNENLLGLSFSYDYLFGGIYKGSYELDNGNNRGLFSNNGNLLNFNLKYTFTRAQKRFAIENGFYQENKSMDETRLQFKMDKRYIDPKSILLNASIGFFGARNKVSKGFPFMKSASLIGEIYSINAEMGHKKNRFYQIGLNRAQYYTANNLILFPEKYGSGATGGTLFKAFQVSAGYGIRLIGKNNINFLNVSAGIGLNISNGLLGNGISLIGYMEDNSGDLVYTLEIYGDIRRKVYPTAYLNLSRDFQMTKLFYFTVDYRQNFGMINVYQETIFIHKQPDLSEEFTGTSKINGTGYAFQIGLKYKFLPKQ